METDRQTYGWSGTQTERQTDGQREKETEKNCEVGWIVEMWRVE